VVPAERVIVMFTLEALDVVIGRYLPRLRPDDPRASPLHGDWRGLPPLRFHVSSSEMLLDCRRRFNFEPPCRLNIEPGVEADVEMVGCG
jgi:acetyl esterase/lipase